MKFLIKTKVSVSSRIIEVILLPLKIEEYLERFFETLLNEINSDDEPYHKKSRHPLAASLRSEDPDDFFISLCGWSLDTLIEKAKSF